LAYLGGTKSIKIWLNRFLIFDLQGSWQGFEVGLFGHIISMVKIKLHKIGYKYAYFCDLSSFTVGYSMCLMNWSHLRHFRWNLEFHYMGENWNFELEFRVDCENLAFSSKIWGTARPLLGNHLCSFNRNASCTLHTQIFCAQNRSCVEIEPVLENFVLRQHKFVLFSTQAYV
jgi:hypothetical protein